MDNPSQPSIANSQLRGSSVQQGSRANDRRRGARINCSSVGAMEKLHVWTRVKQLYDRAKSANAAYSLVDRVWTILTFLLGSVLSALLAWLTSWWNWYWTTFSWAGAAFAFLVAWIALSVGAYLFSLFSYYRRAPSFLHSDKTEINLGTPQRLLKEAHIAPVRFGEAPEYRAIPNKKIKEATLWIEYSYYTTITHQWEKRRRIFLSDVRDVEVGEWSIIKRRLMSTYKNDAGKTLWRWGDGTEQPTDNDYLYLIDHHYRGRVVLKVNDGEEDACYFRLFPIDSQDIGKPFFVNYNDFYFAREWETE